MVRGPALAVMSTVVRSSSPDSIWLATVRSQISSYRRAWAGSRKDLVSPGRSAKSVGRIASCASWAFFALVTYLRRGGGRLAPPEFDPNHLRMAAGPRAPTLHASAPLLVM